MKFLVGCAAAILAASSGYGQNCAPMPSSMSSMPGMQMADDSARRTPSPALELLMRQSSGTDTQPHAWAMPMAMTRSGDWNLMWMAQAFVVETQQGGPPNGRSTPGATGLDKVWSTNWGMLGASRQLAGGTLMLRAMMSLEPATISDRRYPELFQTGETAFGLPIVDGQHPHNLFMELAAEYARPFARGVGYVYYAPVGDPALGPPAYPHRASAAELPQAPLGHHWEDSTHIAANVVTVGVDYSLVRLELSGFHGQEPGENRWTISEGAMDSWSARVVVNPLPSLTAQVSTAELHHPEAFSAGNEGRTTASVEYAAGRRAASLTWGRDYKSATESGSYAVNAMTAEGLLPLSLRNLLTARYEWSQRDELFATDPAVQHAFDAQEHRWFDVGAYTAGYTREISHLRDAHFGAGVNATLYQVPEVLHPYYGAHPWGVNVYVRVRLRAQ